MVSDTPSPPPAPAPLQTPLPDSAAPFIVTAELPADLLAWSDALRRAHFPPERNWLKAHVTLFHAFAPSLREELLGLLGQYAGEYAPPRARIEGLMDLGGGTALAIRSPGMLAIRAAIAERFHGALTAQDRHPPRLHITIQNKVEPAIAKALLAQLAAGFQPRPLDISELVLWRYLGGPWDEVQRWRFSGVR